MAQNLYVRYYVQHQKSSFYPSSCNFSVDFSNEKAECRVIHSE